MRATTTPGVGEHRGRRERTADVVRAARFDRRSLYNKLARAIPLLILLFGAHSLPGCDATYREETELFERAEQSYARGDYDGAFALYRRFLELHPTSPLASIAEQRVLTIERELDAVMGRRGAPAPVYVSPYGSPAVIIDESAHALPRIDPPELPVLGR